jgi:hypothetical protein
MVAGMGLGLAVLTKLIPLVIFPNFLKQCAPRHLLKLYAAAGITILLCSLPFVSPALVSGMRESIGLYFNRFEFNASVYYVVRWIGFWLSGYNMIGLIGKILPLITLLLVMSISLLNISKKLLLSEMMLVSLSVYFFLSTTIHPWYVITLVGITPLTRMRYPLVWSVLIFMSYAGYGLKGYEEQGWVLWIEYLSVYGYFFYELWLLTKKSKPDGI